MAPANEHILPIVKDVVKDVRQLEKSAKSSRPQRLEKKKREGLPETEDCFFKVVDISFDGTAAKEKGKCTFVRDLEQFYETVPPQDEGYIRVIFDGRPYSLGTGDPPRHFNCWNNSKDTSGNTPAVCPLYPGSQLDNPPRYRHMAPLRDMLDGRAGRYWHRVYTFVLHDLYCAHHPETKHILQVDTDQYEKSEINLRVVSETKRKPIVICRAPAATIKWTDDYSFPMQCSNANWRFLTELEWSLQEEVPLLRHSEGSESCAVQLLLLHVLEINLELVSYFIDTLHIVVQFRDNARLKGFENPPSFIGQRLIGRVITLGNVEDSLVFLTRSIELVSTSIRLSSTSPLPQQLACYLEMLEQDCDERRDHISRLKQKSTDTHNALANSYSTKQANSVNQLTLLAAFFLPLSLAAAVLSMQTRLAELHLLLYDFLGVVVILGALAAFFAWINRYGGKLYEMVIYANYGHRADNHPKIKKTLMVFWMAVWWAALLTSFLVGMLNDVTLGLKILGYETAGITTLWVCSWKGFRWIYDRQRDRKRRRQEEKKANRRVNSSSEPREPIAPGPPARKRSTHESFAL